ncbi:hypothetical protein GQX73_g6234 [Xylaria multiplex]|uniref:Uncharacterized protein n=1 Tax=Xylaria multiplex TaxID=323545 RepID=A0A7C8IN13_9PEZI|nr:hypothetical protein GQX73_g6234 [Xylaria multiplex]
MAEITASKDTCISHATTSSTHKTLPPLPNAVGVFEPLHYPPINIQQVSRSNAQTASQWTPLRSVSDLSSTTPLETQCFGSQCQEDQLRQSDLGIQSFSRRSTVVGQPLTEVSIGDSEVSAPSIAEPPRSRLKKGRWETIGAWGCFVIIGGCFGILAIFTFITFLWFGGGRAPEAADASRLWQEIILSGRVAQAITIASLLLRIVVSTQAASCTSLLAALFLEKRAVRVSHLPHFSVARGTNDGPRALLQMIIGSSTRRLLFTVETLLMLVLTLDTLGLQFSSTILLSDLRSLVVVTSGRPMLLKTSFSDHESFFYTSNEGSSPEMAIYGEAPSNATFGPGTRGPFDTGLKQRALLPMQSPENRTMVRSYQGSAVVGNSRVACMPPIINGSVLPDPEPNAQVTSGRVQGTLDYYVSFRTAMQDSTIPSCLEAECKPLLLDCAIPALIVEDGVAQSSICIIGAVGGDYWPEQDGPSWKSSDPPWAKHGTIHMVLSTNMSDTSWERFKSTPLKPTHHLDEWTSYEVSPTRVGGPRATSYISCLFCTATGLAQHPLITAILTDTITQTNRAALAIDSWIFMMMQSVYYEIHQLLTKNEEVQVGFTKAVEAPSHCWDDGGCRGYIAVSVLAFIHIMCVTYITVLYLTQTRYSRLGDIWHTVSQLQCSELGDVLLKSNNAKDSEIVELLKDNSGDHLMKIDMSADGSRIEAVKFEDDPRVVSNKHTSSTTTKPRVKVLLQKLFVKGKKGS